jgi:predicted hydrolase (HD superfamily)
MVMIQREEAYAMVKDLVKNENLIKHMLTVEAALEDYAMRLGQDKNLWGVTGLLHDADWEAYPDIHPKHIVKILRERNQNENDPNIEEMAHAIASHGNGDRFEKRESLLDHYLYACDELSGFIVACALVNPEKLSGVKITSVIKRLKDKSFARGVNREDITESLQEIGLPIETHVENVLNSLLRIKDTLGL